MISRLISPLNYLSCKVSNTALTRSPFPYVEFDCSTQNYTFIIDNSLEIKLWWQEKTKSSIPDVPDRQISCSHYRKNRRRRGPSGMDLQSRNASDSSDHVVKIVEHLGCLGCGAPTGRKNPTHRKIVKIIDSYHS